MVRIAYLLLLLSLLYGCAPAPTSPPTTSQEPAPQVEAQAAQPAEATVQAPAPEESAPAVAEPSPSGDTVYVTKTGGKYHRAGCGSLSRSQIAISREQAIANGYEPCGRCDP